MDDNNISYLVVNALKSHNTDHTPYKGTFTADTFHDLIRQQRFFKGTSYFIVNTLTTRSHYTEVGHWVAISLRYVPSRKMMDFKFFDSFAKSAATYYRPHISKAIDLIRQQCRKLNVKVVFDTLTKPIQSITSKCCGLFAALFVIKSSLQKKVGKISRMFNSYISRAKKKFLNDRSALGELVKYFPSCHDRPIYKNMKKPVSELREPPPFCAKKTLGGKRCYIRCECAKKPCTST